MNNAIEKAKKFLNEEKAFRLGNLLTESFHPGTRALSETALSDLPAAVRLLQSVDQEIPPAMEKLFQQDVFHQLIDAFAGALCSNKRIYFTGCGATGRLSILLEAAYRCFWQQLSENHPDISANVPDMEDRAFGIMAGGDFALIKSVEGFEDFPDFGRYQLKQAGVRPGDIVVAVTEGGETPFVIGTAWQGLDAGANIFFVYNNPTDLLRTHVQRSREIIDHPGVKKLDLTTGPMAITGSTRMQAVTAELLAVGAALEMAVVKFLQQNLPLPQLSTLGLCIHPPEDYPRLFAELLTQLSSPANVNAMADVVEFEEDIYRRHGLVTYIADAFLPDVLTDTTERSPTFMVPPFRKSDDRLSPRSWAFVKDPFHPTPHAWQHLLRRRPRGLQWTAETYKQLNAPLPLQTQPPRLDNGEIFKFQIGSEPDPSRTDAPDSALVVIGAADEIEHLSGAARQTLGSEYKKTAVMVFGPQAHPRTDKLFHFRCDLPASPLQLWRHLAIKLVLNTISTATMVRMGRVVGNAMAWLSPSNKKLIDRGSRLISELTGCAYEQACIALFEAMDEIESRKSRAEEVPSPVALAIESIRSAAHKTSL